MPTTISTTKGDRTIHRTTAPPTPEEAGDPGVDLPPRSTVAPVTFGIGGYLAILGLGSVVLAAVLTLA